MKRTMMFLAVLMIGLLAFTSVFADEPVPPADNYNPSAATVTKDEVKALLAAERQETAKAVRRTVNKRTDSRDAAFTAGIQREVGKAVRQGELQGQATREEVRSVANNVVANNKALGALDYRIKTGFWIIGFLVVVFGIAQLLRSWGIQRHTDSALMSVVTGINGLALRVGLCEAANEKMQGVITTGLATVAGALGEVRTGMEKIPDDTAKAVAKSMAIDPERLKDPIEIGGKKYHWSIDPELLAKGVVPGLYYPPDCTIPPEEYQRREGHSIGDARRSAEAMGRKPLSPTQEAWIQYLISKGEFKPVA